MLTHDSWAADQANLWAHHLQIFERKSSLSIEQCKCTNVQYRYNGKRNNAPVVECSDSFLGNSTSVDVLQGRRNHLADDIWRSHRGPPHVPAVHPASLASTHTWEVVLAHLCRTWCHRRASTLSTGLGTLICIRGHDISSGAFVRLKRLVTRTVADHGSCRWMVFSWWLIHASSALKFVSNVVWVSLSIFLRWSCCMVIVSQIGFGFRSYW